MQRRGNVVRKSGLASCIIAGLLMTGCDETKQPLAPRPSMSVEGEQSGEPYLVETVYPESEKQAAAAPPPMSPSMSGNLVVPGASLTTVTATPAYTVQAVPFSPEAPVTANRILNCDDCVLYGIPLGFNFTFYGQTYDKVDLSSNAILGFGATIGTSYTPNTIPLNDGYSNMIALAWSDWYPPGGGSVHYQTRGTAPNRRFIFQFTNVLEFFSGPSRLTAQLILHEGSNEITMYVWGLSPLPNHFVTQGIEAPLGASAVVFSQSRNRERFTLLNDAIRFSPGSANTAPSITAPADLTFDNDSGVCHATVALLGEPTVTDDGAYEVGVPTRSDGAAFDAPYPVGTVTLTWVVTDAAGLTDSDEQTVTVSDVEAPTVASPPDQTVPTDAGRPYATVTPPAGSATDNCDEEVTVTTPAAGQLRIGPAVLTYSATDAAGNTGSDDWNVTVVDQEPPALTIPPDFTVNTDLGQPTAVVLFTPTAIDNSGSATVSCDPVSGSAYRIGTTLVTCIATDASNNSTPGSFNVTVVDNERPSLTIPPSFAVNATMPGGAVINFTSTAWDNSGPVSVSCTPPSGSTYAIGVTTAICTATDPSGNSTSGSFTVTVIGARAQIEALIARVTALSLHNGTSQPLLSMLATALRDPGATAPEVACIKLDDFIFKLRDHKAVASIPQITIDEMIADSQRIQNVLGCP